MWAGKEGLNDEGRSGGIMLVSKAVHCPGLGLTFLTIQFVHVHNKPPNHNIVCQEFSKALCLNPCSSPEYIPDKQHE